MIRIFSEFCRRGGLYGRPEAGAKCSSPVGCFGWAGADMQSAPTGLVEMIRIFSEFCRRGGLYGRPEPGALCSGPGGCFGWAGADMQSAPTGLVEMIRIFSEFCRRGGLYGRPEPGALCSGPGGSGGWARTRDARPYGWCVRRGRIGHRTAARAAIQAAPTGSQAWVRSMGVRLASIPSGPMWASAPTVWLRAPAVRTEEK